MGILLASLASLSFVGLDVLRKVLGKRLSASQIVIGINLGSGLILLSTLLWFGEWNFDSIFLILGAVEILTFTVASILYVRAVTLSPLSLTIPYLAFTPVVSALVALFVLDEVPSPRGTLGIGLVVIGALILHLGDRRTIGELLKAPLHEPGSWRMLLVALIWGVTTSIDKVAISHGSELLLATVLSLGSAFFLIAISLFRSPFRRGQRTANTPEAWREPLLYAAALVGAIAVLCQFFAYRELLVAYVESIKRTGGVMSALIGITFFKEGGFANRIPAAIMMVSGAILIFW